ncbi:MAG: hypothetical protein HQK69_08360 [Desulfamplus sp.]|nr:hypothetical protein [Desulfamplus sp.]
MKTISADKLREYIQKEHEKSYILIDVRQPAEYEESHIPGSILLPLNEFEEQVEELPEKNLIFYCRSGVRSKAAALTADFFNDAKKDIYTLEGGVLGWNGITVEGIPLFKTFDLDKDIYAILLDAINLEKGAFRFYDYILQNVDLNNLEKLSSKNNDRAIEKDKTSINEVLKQARDGELGHAKLIYSNLKNIKTDTVTFENIYNALNGDILEGGASFDQVIKLIEKESNNKIIDILEIAISMEYRAFDLYRVMSERIDDENDKLKEAFYSLAQAEKAHMNILVKALEQRV